MGEIGWQIPGESSVRMHVRASHQSRLTMVEHLLHDCHPQSPDEIDLRGLCRTLQSVIDSRPGEFGPGRSQMKRPANSPICTIRQMPAWIRPILTRRSIVCSCDLEWLSRFEWGSAISAAVHRKCDIKINRTARFTMVTKLLATSSSIAIGAQQPAVLPSKLSSR